MLVFEPGGLIIEGAYNLWRGWGVQPKAGDCSLFLAHLRDNVCSGDEELYRWVLAWFAHILRFPRTKIGTALVVRGRQGTGKSIVGEIFGVLIGPSFLKVSMARHLTGNFNALLGERLLVQAEEAFWAGDRAAVGVLKDLITSATIVIERKGLDPDRTANYVRLFVTSNSIWAPRLADHVYGTFPRDNAPFAGEPRRSRLADPAVFAPHRPGERSEEECRDDARPHRHRDTSHRHVHPERNAHDMRHREEPQQDHRQQRCRFHRPPPIRKCERTRDTVALARAGRAPGGGSVLARIVPRSSGARRRAVARIVSGSP